MLDEAILEYKKAIDINPNDAKARNNLGLAYYDKGMLDEAILECKKAIDINPNDAKAHCGLGLAYYDKGMLDEAILEYKKAIDINPNDAMAHCGLGIAYGEKGMFDEAVLECKKAIDINPNDAKARNNLGLAYYDKGMLDEAILEYKKAIDINPNYAKAHCGLGLAYYDKGMLDEAILEYKKAINIDPNLAMAHCGLGIAYGEKGMFDEAVLECKKAIDINPNFAVAHNNLAVAYYYKGQYDLAIKHCNRAIELGYEVSPELLEALGYSGEQKPREQEIEAASKAYQLLHRPVLRINDTVLNIDDFIEGLRRSRIQRAKDLGQMNLILESTIVQMQNEELIRQALDRYGIPSPTEKEIDEEIREMAGEENYKKAVKNKEIRRMVESTLRHWKLRDYLGRDKILPQEQAHVRGIWAGTKEEAEEVISRLKRGEDFTHVASKLSQNEASKDKGGDMGWLPRGIWGDEFDRAVFNTLELGEVSSPIFCTEFAGAPEYTRGGYWVLKPLKSEDRKVHVLGILLGSKEEAEEAIKRMEEGEEFSDLASELSLDPSKDKGGDLGWKGEDYKFFDDVSTSNPYIGPIFDPDYQKMGGYWVVEVLEWEERKLSHDMQEVIKGKTLNEWMAEERKEAALEIYLDDELMLFALENL
jgi:Flp pilus assembly protein TadD/parvulin-like peptidyl-prolyl isomerase